MTDTQNTPLQDPDSHILLAFANEQDTNIAVDLLVSVDISGAEIKVFNGPIDAESVETESRWFADTHEILRRFHDVLAEGGQVVAMEVSEFVTPEIVMNALGPNRPLLAFHFGQIVTKSLSIL